MLVVQICKSGNVRFAINSLRQSTHVTHFEGETAVRILVVTYHARRVIRAHGSIKSDVLIGLHCREHICVTFIHENLLEQAASVEEQVEFNTLKWQIGEALQKLPPRQRAVIVQRYYLEMSEKEMAVALDIAPGTVKWLLNTARARLRDLLGSERSAE